MYFNNGYNGYPVWGGYQPQSSYLPNQPWGGGQPHAPYLPDQQLINSPVPTPSMAKKSSPSLRLPSVNTGSDMEGRTMIYPGYKLRHGDKGEIVEEIQKRLGISADGVFGTELEEMVRRFQMDNNIQPSGNVGPKTWEKMFGSLNSPSTFSVKNDTEKDAVVIWTAKKCRGSMYGIPNVCHYELLLPDQVQTYEFDEKTNNRRVGIVRKGSLRTLPISSSVPNKHEFTVSSIRSSGVKLSRRQNPRRNAGANRRELVQRVQAMMNGVVSGVKDRFPYF